MRRHLLLFIVFLALIAASCGSDQSTALDVTTKGGDNPRIAATGASAKLSQGSALVLAAAETTSAVDDVHISMTGEVGGLPDFDGQVVSFAMEAAVSGDGSRGQLVLDFGDLVETASPEDPGALGAVAGVFSEPIEVRFADDAVYVSSAFIAWLFPVDTPWVAFSAESDAQIGEIGLTTETLSVAELMMVLRGMEAEPEVVGTEVINGVDTTHVRGRFSAAKLAELGGDFDLGGFDFGDFDPTGLGGIELEELDVDVWIGEDELVRRLRFGLDELSGLHPTAAADAFFAFTIDLNDIGVPVTVDIPPASEVTFLDDLFG